MFVKMQMFVKIHLCREFVPKFKNSECEMIRILEFLSIGLTHLDTKPHIIDVELIFMF